MGEILLFQQIFDPASYLTVRDLPVADLTSVAAPTAALLLSELPARYRARGPCF